MNGEQVDALAAAAADGIEFDGFAARTQGEGYVLGTEEGSETLVHESDLRSAADEYADYVTNWYFWHAEAPQAEDRWAFLRWLEGVDDRCVPERYDALGSGDTGVDDAGEGDTAGDDAAESTGVVKEWGQLQVTITADADGFRRYEVRNVEDAGRPTDELTTHDDPLDARQIAKRDDRERYRPLKTAPTLRTGWRFADLGPRELLQTVDFFYPATVANWHRERVGERSEATDGASGDGGPASGEGELDVTHWRETVDRQTGIYGVVKTWDRQEGHEHVDWLAEACCVDSQCLKRREWQYDEDTDLSVDGGEGEFPCREPCSLVISAARRFTKLEGEESRTYEFELTPSEKEQVEDIVDAVADGRTEEIREADVYDGANRYRARFLRAKRFDDEGNLSGIPTDQAEDAESASVDGEDTEDGVEDDEKSDD